VKKIEENALIQIESLLNECKGNLFEYLVAQHLAKFYEKEGDFLLKLPSDYRKRLQFYEQTIRHHNAEILISLSPMAQQVANEITYHSILKNKKIDSLYVIGKLSNGTNADLWNETDIVVIEDLQNGETKKHYLSLKLSKDHSFTHTKSAGVKSFLEKYFNSIGPRASELQQEFNNDVDESFFMMGHKLYEMIDGDFRGHFDHRFTSLYSELPGELSPEMRKVIHQNYFRVISKLKIALNELYLINPHVFFQSLSSLCGFSQSEIIQVNCIHSKNALKTISIKSFEDLFGDPFSTLDFSGIEEGGSSFEIRLKKVNLQVRIKPMNKFTTAAYKVNCSIKYKGESIE